MEQTAVNWSELATVVGGFATAIALVGAFMAMYQSSKNAKSQALANAKSLYRDFLDLSFQHPYFAYADLAKVEKEKQFEKYKLFMWHLLYACEEILACTNDNDWRDTVRTQLLRHKDFLKSTRSEVKINLYSDELAKLIREIQ